MPQNELQRLNPRHHRIIDLHLEGLKNVEIAQALNITQIGVGLVLNSPLTQDEVARRRKIREHSVDELATTGVLRAREILETAAEDAALTQVDLIGSDYDPRTRLAASKEILGAAFPREGAEGGGGVVRIDKAVIQNLQVAVQESRGGREKDDD